MAMPPTMSALTAIEDSVRERHDHNGSCGASASKELIRHIAFMVDLYSIKPQHMKNTWDMIHSEVGPDHDIVFFRFVSALQKDTEIIRQAWVDLRDKAERELLAFAPK